MRTLLRRCFSSGRRCSFQPQPRASCRARFASSHPLVRSVRRPRCFFVRCLSSLVSLQAASARRRLLAARPTPPPGTLLRGTAPPRPDHLFIGSFEGPCHAQQVAVAHPRPSRLAARTQLQNSATQASAASGSQQELPRATPVVQWTQGSRSIAYGALLREPRRAVAGHARRLRRLQAAAAQLALIIKTAHPAGARR